MVGSVHSIPVKTWMNHVYIFLTPFNLKHACNGQKIFFQRKSQKSANILKSVIFTLRINELAIFEEIVLSRQ